jgi:hypothetical protein
MELSLDICFILKLYGATKKEWLLEENHKHSETQQIVRKQNHPCEVDESIINKSMMFFHALKIILYTHTCICTLK